MPLIRLAVIGDPAAHSLSPIFQNAMLAALGLHAEYRARRVPADALDGWLREAVADGLAGFNATMPHKQALLPLLHALSPDAARCGAVNTVTIRNGVLTGYNTDGAGFARALADRGLSLTGRVTLLGAGGAARAVALKLAEQAEVTLCCRRPDKARDMAALSPRIRVEKLDRLPALLERSALFVNATPLGMAGAPEDFPAFDFLDAAPVGCAVCDLIYRPAQTALLRAAERRGLPALNGLDMLIEQGLLSLELFLGRPLPAPALRAVARAALTQALDKETRDSSRLYTA